jgi:hypothetical protein
MTQNLLSRSFTADDLAAFDNALDTLDTLFAGFPEFSADEIRGLNKMGDRSEPFCRQALMVLAQNTDVLPPSFDLTEAQHDLADLDALRPRLHRLQRLTTRADHAETAFGSDVKSASDEGYTLLRVANRSAALDALRDAMLTRLGRNTSAKRGTPPAGV